MAEALTVAGHAGVEHLLARALGDGAGDDLTARLFAVEHYLHIGLGLLRTVGLKALGAQPPLAEWGCMLAEGRDFMRDHMELVVYPGIFIMITVLAFNLLGDGLRDALDPRMKN